MKKLILTLFAVLLCLTVFSGCESKADNDITLLNTDDVVDDHNPLTCEGCSETTEGLCAEIESRILQDYFNTYMKGKFGWDEEVTKKNLFIYPSGWKGLTAKDLFVAIYYGNYNDCFVMEIGGFPSILHTRDSTTENILGPPILTTWKDGQIHTWEDAYEFGLLTGDNIIDIFTRGEIIGVFEDVSPVTEPHDLTPATEVRILQDFYDTNKELLGTPVTYNVGTLHVTKYYGTYNGYYLLRIATKWGAPTPGVSPVTITIGGVKFFCPKCDRFWYEFEIWKDGQFYYLPEAYNTGLFTWDDIINIADFVGLYYEL
jgi:hypothetical protein